MTGVILVKDLRYHRRASIGWAIGLVVTIGLMCALWPSVRGMTNIEEFLASYPEAFRKMFNMANYTTGAGYLNAELFSSTLPLLMMVFAIGRGARLVAGEEEARTLEVVLATPVPRWQILAEKAAAVAASVIGLGLVTFLTTWVSSLAFDMGVPVGQVAAGTLALVLIGLEFGWLALAVGAATGRRAVAIGVAAVVAVAGYLLYILGRILPSVEPWAAASPFHQAIKDGPIGGGLPLSFLLMIVTALVIVAVATPIFDRRDIAA
jgi:ABC-2 type transport system permease protein